MVRRDEDVIVPGAIFILYPWYKKPESLYEYSKFNEMQNEAFVPSSFQRILKSDSSFFEYRDTSGSQS